MKAFVLKGRGETAYIEKPFPELRDAHGAILKPLMVAPCTSDVHTVWQGSPKTPDLTLGHECVAEVVEVGAEVKDFHKGDVVCVPAITPDWSSPDVYNNPSHAGVNFSAHMLGKSIDGAFQEAFYLPYADKNLALIPDGVSMEAALMCADVLSTGFTAAEEADFADADSPSVVVMGIGAIGLAAIMASKYYGASHIFAIGSRPDNVKIAESLGAEVLDYRTLTCELPDGMHPMANSTGAAFVNYVLKKTGTKGVDKVLICGGSDYALAQAADMVKYGTGVVSNVSYFGSSPSPESSGISDFIPLPKFSMGRGMAGKTLKFSLSKGGRARTEFLLGLCRDGLIHPEVLVTKHYKGLDKIEQALYDMKNREAIKIAVEM